MLHADHLDEDGIFVGGKVEVCSIPPRSAH